MYRGRIKEKQVWKKYAWSIDYETLLTHSEYCDKTSLDDVWVKHLKNYNRFENPISAITFNSLKNIKILL